MTPAPAADADTADPAPAPRSGVARRAGESVAGLAVLLMVLVLCGLALADSPRVAEVEDGWLVVVNTSLAGPLGLPSQVIAVALGSVGGWVAAAVVLVVVVVRRGRGALPAAFLLVVVPVALTHITKAAVQRPRPHPGGLVHVFPVPSGDSFPSGHTTIGAALAVLVALLLWRVHPRVALPVVLLVPTAVALSRLVLAVHFPSDVVAGLLVVALGDLLVWRALPTSWREDLLGPAPGVGHPRRVRRSPEPPEGEV